MTFEHFIDKILWALMISVAGYGANQIQSATTSINDLNNKMSTVIEKLSFQSRFVEDHESRLRSLEKKK